MMKLYPRRCGVITAVVLTGLLTAGGLPVSAQTDEPDGYPDPVYPFASGVCAGERWSLRDVLTDADIARVCLILLGVNDGLGEYAFVKKTAGYDPGNPAGGGPEEAGLVSRWAMAEALTRTIEAAAGTPLRAPSGEAEAFFTDIGWLTADTRKRIAQLYDLEVTKGTSEAGVYDPAGPVTRGQMALFFVRTLSVIEELAPEGLPEFGIEGVTFWPEPFSVVWEKEAERIASGLEEAEADRLDCRASVGFRERVLRMPFVDVCGWDNDDERFPAIKLIYDLGVTIGVSADSEGRRYYQAAEPVTGGQMALFLVRLLSHTNIPPTEVPDAADSTETELPEIQTDGSQRQLGDRRRDGSYLTIEESNRGLRRYNEPLPAPAATRPPREIDYYRYVLDKSNIWDLNLMVPLSEPISLQIGDWWWNEPPYTDDEYRSRYVLMEFRTAVGYRQALPFTTAFFCRIHEGDPGPEDNPESTRYQWALRTFLPDGPGLFRKTNRLPAGDVEAAAGYCNLGDYDVPVPAGGYTERYPCAGDWPANAREHWGDSWDWLQPCQP